MRRHQYLWYIILFVILSIDLCSSCHENVFHIVVVVPVIYVVGEASTVLVGDVVGEASTVSVVVVVGEAPTVPVVVVVGEAPNVPVVEEFVL